MGDVFSHLIFSWCVAIKHFASGKPALYWHKHDVDWVPTLQLAKKNYRAKLDHNANAERAEMAKSDMNLRAIEQERELKRLRTSKACGKQSPCCRSPSFRRRGKSKLRELAGFFF